MGKKTGGIKTESGEQLQSGLAGKKLAWKKYRGGNVAEEVVWARQERAWNGRHCLNFFLWAIVRNHSFPSNNNNKGSKVVIDKPAK